ncbi:glutamyl-tRNA synthetase [Aspergillus japonicus CBS 114.51]|uniref:Glutamyl-tRNA synthetase n=2 Tax=Aspergillus TaxID=5052 RepID=A0A2V5H893_ASPV1|nr:glutamyl-tRNA synthetase [Aspergillus japonicus CBS 114.51]PYI18402.1 glutamyl-tRNA synthetase [Aspergillus violaceofuscus CBS 115571]RAH86430.1 glutamyl-tRNA synthetase [Aspergillus japonicus CBS 114.51]
MDPLTHALQAIDALHSADPTTTATGTPNELHYAQRMTAWLYRHIAAPESPSAALQLAIRAQHLKRWEVPRATYPAGKAGYYAWRTGLARRQAALAIEVCAASGIAEAEAQRVGRLIRKEGLKGQEVDAEAQVLEDVACLVFLEEQLEQFQGGYEEDKVVAILRKTWGKMSERGRELALTEVKLGERGRELVGLALGDS